MWRDLCFFWIFLRPSGAANREIKKTSFKLTPFPFIKSIAAIEEFPVASIGSSTNIFLFFVFGNLNKYSTGLYVCSSLYKPICPFSTSGKNFTKPSKSPNPALKIGTSTICWDSFLPTVLVRGVWTLTFLYGKNFIYKY